MASTNNHGLFDIFAALVLCKSLNSLDLSRHLQFVGKLAICIFSTLLIPCLEKCSLYFSSHFYQIPQAAISQLHKLSSIPSLIFQLALAHIPFSNKPEYHPQNIKTNSLHFNKGSRSRSTSFTAMMGNPTCCILFSRLNFSLTVSPLHYNSNTKRLTLKDFPW